MSGLFRAGGAAVGAHMIGKRLGCGCVGTVVLFFVLFWLLGRVF